MSLRARVLALLKIALLVLVFPFAAAIVAFVGAYRYFLTKLHRRIHGGSILSTQSSLYYDPQQERPLKIQLHFKFSGRIDFQLFCQKLTEAVLDKKKPSGQLVYPELQQYARLWLGYYFWTQDPKFSIENHVVNYTDPGSSSEVGSSVPLQISDEICREAAIAGLEIPFPKDRSPWLITLFNNLQLDCEADGGTLIIFKFGHYLADGYSIFHLITQCADQARIQIYQPKQPSKCKQLTRYMCSPFAAILESMENERGDLPIWETCSAGKAEGHNSFSRHYVPSGDIPTENIRALASKLDVTFTAMILSTVQAGILKYFHMKGIELPEYFRTLFPIPAPRNYYSLTNLLNYVIADIPTSRYASPTAQVTTYNKKLLQLKESSSSLWNGILTRLMGLLSISLTLIKLVQPKRKYYCDIFYSIFPGPSCEISMLGHPVKKVDYLINVFAKSAKRPLTFTILTYNGKIRFWLSTLPELFTKEETDELLSLIETEFEVCHLKYDDSKSTGNCKVLNV